MEMLNHMFEVMMEARSGCGCCCSWSVTDYLESCYQVNSIRSFSFILIEFPRFLQKFMVFCLLKAFKVHISPQYFLSLHNISIFRWEMTVYTRVHTGMDMCFVHILPKKRIVVSVFYFFFRFNCFI